MESIAVTELLQGVGREQDAIERARMAMQRCQTPMRDTHLGVLEEERDGQLRVLEGAPGAQSRLGVDGEGHLGADGENHVGAAGAIGVRRHGGLHWGLCGNGGLWTLVHLLGGDGMSIDGDCRHSPEAAPEDVPQFEQKAAPGRAVAVTMNVARLWEGDGGGLGIGIGNVDGVWNRCGEGYIDRERAGKNDS